MRNAASTKRYRLAALGLFCALGLAFGGAVSAQDLREDGSAVIYTEVIIPDATPAGQTIDKRVEYFTEGKVVDLAQYLGFMYNFLMSIAGLVASVMVIIGGVQYLTSAGDAGKIGAAKTRITNAFMGLVLVLGAYTILRTINPELLNLKPLNVKGVTTELVFLPICEDLVKTGTKVDIVLSGTDTDDTGRRRQTGYCGSIGEFKAGKSFGYCRYRGDADPCIVTTENSPIAGAGEMKVPLNCAPYPMSQGDAAKLVAEFRALKWKEDGSPADRATSLWLYGTKEAGYKDGHNLYPAGLCSSCASSVNYIFRNQGLPVPQGYCAVYQNEANRGGGFDTKTFAHVKASNNQKYVQYCSYDANEKTCVGTVIYCMDPIPESGGCYDGYNKVKDLFYYAEDGKVGGWTYGSDKLGTLNAHPGHLSNVCNANPCGYNLSKGGCTGEGGTVNGIRTAAAVVRDGILGIQACDNK